MPVDVSTSTESVIVDAWNSRMRAEPAVGAARSSLTAFTSRSVDGPYATTVIALVAGTSMSAEITGAVAADEPAGTMLTVYVPGWIPE